MDYLNQLINWANQNQGFLAIILFSVSLLVGWISGFFKWIYRKFDKKTTYISTIGDIKARCYIPVGNKTFVQKNGKNSTNVQGENITVNKYGNDK